VDFLDKNNDEVYLSLSDIWAGNFYYKLSKLCGTEIISKPACTPPMTILERVT
jgi:hypothetical protein